MNSVLCWGCNMKLLKAIINRLFIIAYGLDQLLAGIILLKPDHTISGEAGYAKHCGKRWGRIVAPVIDAIVFWQPDHCHKSIEWDEARKPPQRIWP